MASALLLGTGAEAAVLFTDSSSFLASSNAGITELIPTNVDYQPLTLNKYTPGTGINVTSVVVTLGGTLRSTGFVANNATQAQDFNVSITGKYRVVADIGAPAPLANFYTNNGSTGLNPINTVTAQAFNLFGGTGNLTSLATAGTIANQSFVNVAPNGSFTPIFSQPTVTLPTITLTFTGADIAAFLTAGSFSLNPYTRISTTVNGGGGNINTVIGTRASAIATITYNGTTEEVPFEFSPALGLSLVGSLYLGKRFFKNFRNQKIV